MKQRRTQEPSTRKAEDVQAMFGAIAPRYDFANHLLSLNWDRRWRRFAVRRLVERLRQRNFDALDLACGTGDLTLALSQATSGRVVGMDFCHPMLAIGAKKLRLDDHARSAALVEADALRLPLEDSSVDAVSIAFGLRNLENYEEGLREMFRVLRPRGAVAILEFSRPRWPLFRLLFEFYFFRILPRLGALVSGVEGPYAYLPDSVSRFPDPESLKSMMEAAGFERVEYFNLSGGIAALHLGTRGA